MPMAASLYLALALAGGLLPSGEKERVTREAVDRALAYLAARQNEDGSWTTPTTAGQPSPGIMALAVMAFYSAGHTARSGPYQHTVQAALHHIVSQAGADGLLAHANHQRAMYDHGLACLALAESLGALQDADAEEQVRHAVVRAVDLIVRCQGPEGGWTYRAEPGSHDLSLTVTQVMALRAGRNGGLAVPEVTIERAVEYVRRCFDPSSGGFAYEPGQPARFSMTAAGVAALQVCGATSGRDVMVEQGLAYLLQEKGRFVAPLHHYYYGLYYAAQASFQAGGTFESTFQPSLVTDLVAQQKEDGRFEGIEEGPILATAMAVIVLAAPRRYLPLFVQEKEIAR